MKKTSDVLNPALNKIPEALSGAEDLLGLMQAIIAEWDAIHLYKAIAEASQNPTVKDLMNHLAEEELKHVGELQELAAQLEADTEKYIQEGRKEFLDRNKGTKKEDEPKYETEEEKK